MSSNFFCDGYSLYIYIYYIANS